MEFKKLLPMEGVLIPSIISLCVHRWPPTVCSVSSNKTRPDRQLAVIVVGFRRGVVLEAVVGAEVVVPVGLRAALAVEERREVDGKLDSSAEVGSAARQRDVEREAVGRAVVGARHVVGRDVRLCRPAVRRHPRRYQLAVRHVRDANHARDRHRPVVAVAALERHPRPVDALHEVRVDAWHLEAGEAAAAHSEREDQRSRMQLDLKMDEASGEADLDADIEAVAAFCRAMFTPVETDTDDTDDRVSAFDDSSPDSEDRRPRPAGVRRCISLRTSPGTPHKKKSVRFADALGLDLEYVRQIQTSIDEPLPPPADDDERRSRRPLLAEASAAWRRSRPLVRRCLCACFQLIDRDDVSVKEVVLGPRTRFVRVPRFVHQLFWT